MTIPSLRFLREKLEQALADLDILDDKSCTRKQALNAWDKVFCTDFFFERSESRSTEAVASSPSILTSGMIGSLAAAGETSPVRKEGGGRFA